MDRIKALAAAMAIALGAAGCGDFFGVTSPGRVLDEDLNSPFAMEALVTGMSSDFSAALDEIAFLVGRASDEMTGSGSYFATGLFRRGIIDMEEVDGWWEVGQRARWVAEQGIDRMRAVLDTAGAFVGTPRSVRAFLYAGLANRVLGECFCEAVIDGGPAQPNAVYFERAVRWADSAIAHASLLPDNTTALLRTKDSLLTIGYGVRAQAYVGLNDWAAAIADAAQVPTGFVFHALYSDNSAREENVIFNETWSRPEMSAYAVLAGSFSPPDPRAPWTNCDVSPTPCRSRFGASGDKTPHYRQDKYPELGGDIPAVKGTEMRLIEAEEGLRAGDFVTAMARINDVRTFWGLGNLAAADSAEAFGHLDNERHLTLWLEARRLFDLRRWNHPFLAGGGVVYDAENPRDSCIPISRGECQTNPNLRGHPSCAG